MTKLSNIVGKIKEKGYRAREDQQKLVCPLPDYPNAFIVIPKEWLGEHAIRKDRARQLTAELGSPELTRFAVCMSILDDWGNIPGLNEKDTEKWDLKIVPISIISWVIQAVLTDFNSAYIIPKALSPPSSTLSQGEEKIMDGDLEKKP